MIDTEQNQKPDPSEIEQKIDALLARMTLTEKIGQLQIVNPSIFGTFEETIEELIEKLTEGKISVAEFQNMPRNYHEQEIRDGQLGAMGGVTSAEKSNELQRIAIEESRLGIPLLFGLDVIHGFRTGFPIPLAEACSWEPEKLELSAQIAAREASAAGITWTYAPMVDISRDPRWGRVAEGAGEDTYLGSVMAAARVRGFQGTDLKDTERILACPKHLAAYGAAVGGRDYNTVNLSAQYLHEFYLPPFRAAAEAGAGTFMAAFNDINGIPCSASSQLMEAFLRQSCGFEGFMVSDANAVAECVTHGFAQDKTDASVKTVVAGLDMDMSDGTYWNALPQAIAEGRLQENDIDKAVRHILRVKFRMGLFDQPYRTTPGREEQTLLADAHLAAARDMARRSIVLLKNDNQTLPLKKNQGRLAIVGPLADNQAGMLGTWAIGAREDEVTTILQGIREAVAGQSEILYARGCDIMGTEKDGFAQAIAAAEAADLVIAVVGESSDMSGEAASRIDLTLPGVQEELLRALAATGKPLVVLLANGRPLALPWVAAHASAILETWQLGTLAGHAAADVLFGDFNPSGKLVMTVPYSVGQVPVYYNHPQTGRPAGPIKFTSKYIDGPAEPLYPFGFGLSYTSFAYKDLKLPEGKISFGQKINITATIQNTGKVTGEEIVQLYVADPVASRVRPVRELKGFCKVMLEPGQSQEVTFQLDTRDLGFYDEQLQYLLEPGLFKFWISPDSTGSLEGQVMITNA